MSPTRIQFQFDAEQPVQAELPSNYTKAEFEKIFERASGKQPWMYSFICHGKAFDLSKDAEFREMKGSIVPGMTLFPFTRTKSSFSSLGSLGSNFVDVNDDSMMQRVEWSKNAPSWRMACPGLCLEGICQNGKCAAYGNQVVINIGIKTFDLNLDHGTLSMCPACQCFVTPETCAFNRCRWRFRGQMRRKSTEPPIRVEKGWKVADNAYHRFDETRGEPVNWLQLIFEVEAT